MDIDQSTKFYLLLLSLGFGPPDAKKMHRRTPIPNGCASRAIYLESALGEASIHDFNRGPPRRSNSYICKFRRVEIQSPVSRDVTTFVRRRALQHRASRHSGLTNIRPDLEQRKSATNAVAQSTVNPPDRLAHAVNNVNGSLRSLNPAKQNQLVRAVPIFPFGGAMRPPHDNDAIC
jgi:hypothetical protein